MFENRSLKLDLFALALMAVAAVLGASLVTYDPFDPPSTLVDPPNGQVQNACGQVGAVAAHLLFASVGFLAYYVVCSLMAVGAVTMLRREINQPVLRGVGWASTLAALTTLATLALPSSTPGPEAGAGGYLGAMGSALLESHFALAGAYILALSALLAGLLLATDYVLLRIAAAVAVVPGAGLLRIGRLAGSRAKQKPAAAATEETADEELDEDEEDEYEYEDDEEEWADEGWEDEEDEFDDGGAAPAELKVKTPETKATDVDSQDADEGADAAPEMIAETTAVASGNLRSKLSNALRIKKRVVPEPAEAKAPQRSEREEVIDQLDAAEIQGVEDVDYELPPLDLLLESDDICYEEHEKEVRRKARILEKTFRNFGFNVKVVEIETGPVIAQYEIQLEAGLRLSRITGLADDLAIALRVPSVRIVAPIPGKNTVGIEVPNENRQLVRLREVIEETNGRAKRMKIPVYLGKDVSGNPLVVDLTAMPHLLIAGRTGTGKSVCLNSIIVSLLMSRGPDEVRMLMIDPKMVELSGYKKLPHLMHPVVTDMRKAEAILAWAVDKMEERYALLARAGVRHMSVYNQLSEEELRDRVEPVSEAEWEQIPRNLPFIVIIADEMADLMMTAGKDVEQHIIRLAQKSRAVGIHLILATQKPTVDVITGLIKSNLPARLAFQVASRTDSRVVLDEMGAEKLLGNGDMLFLSPGTSMLLRGQGTYLSDDEITRVTDFVGTDAPQFARELIELKTKEEQEAAQPGGKLKDRDELYEAAVDVVVREQRGSVSLLQRCLGIGYGRAARLIDFMAEDGIVGEYNGSQAREVLLTLSDWEAMSSNDGDGDADDDGPTTVATVAPKPRRSNKIVPGSDDPSDLEPEGPPTRVDSGHRRAPTPSFTGPPVEASTVLQRTATSGRSATAVLTAPWEESEAKDAAADPWEADEAVLETSAVTAADQATNPLLQAASFDDAYEKWNDDELVGDDLVDRESEEELREREHDATDDDELADDATEDAKELEFDDLNESDSVETDEDEWEYEDDEVAEGELDASDVDWEYEDDDDSAELANDDEDEWEYEEEADGDAEEVDDAEYEYEYEDEEEDDSDWEYEDDEGNEGDDESGDEWEEDDLIDDETAASGDDRSGAVGP